MFFTNLENFFKTILNGIFGVSTLYYYTIGAILLFAFLYLIGFFAALCGRLSRIKKAERFFLKNPSIETAHEAIERMPKEIKSAYYAAKAKGKHNPAFSLKYDTCVKTPYAFSFCSKFSKYSFVLTVLMSLLAFSFFSLAANYTGKAGFLSHMWYVLFGYAVAGILGTGLAAIIASSRYKRASRRFVNFSEQFININAQAGGYPDIDSESENIQNSENTHQPAQATSYPDSDINNADELVARINILSKENASVTTLKEAAYQLQQERVKPENANPISQRKLNDALNILIKAMSAAIKK